jgi:hypothetical protein
MADFLRFCELLIGPLADYQGRGNVNEAVQIVSDGTNSRLRVQFSAQKGITGTPNKTDVKIHGLSRETRQAIRGGLTRVQISAGYSSLSQSAALVTVGGLMSVVSMREGADIVTTLSVLDGGGAVARGAYSRAFSGGTPLASVVRDLAASLPGVTIGQIAVDGSLAAKGLQLSGASSSQLDRLADTFGFSWSIQNGVFQALQDDRDTGDAFFFSSESNLINCVPVLNGPTQEEAGVKVTAKFDARMKPGDRMVVESRINPQLSGTYKCTSVALSFDSHGAASIEAQSLRA